jgi:hypothetical protein
VLRRAGDRPFRIALDRHHKLAVDQNGAGGPHVDTVAVSRGPRAGEAPVHVHARPKSPISRR